MSLLHAALKGSRKTYFYIIFTYLSCWAMNSNELMNFLMNFQIFTQCSVSKGSNALECQQYLKSTSCMWKKSNLYLCCASLRPIENLYPSNIDLLCLQGGISIY